MHMSTRAKIINFGAYRRKRERARLPLFPAARPSLPALSTRPLDERQVAHRRVMLKHLTASY
jgi:hypothetical protein